MKNTELLDIQSNAEKTDKQNSSSELVKRTEVKGTPFEIVTIEDRGSFVALGQYRLTDFKESWEDCKKMVDEKHWDLLLSVVCVLVDTAGEIKKEIDNLTNN